MLGQQVNSGGADGANAGRGVTDDQVRQVVEWLEGLRAPEHALDEMVLDQKAGEAASLNNGPEDERAEYLAGAEGGGEDEGDDAHDLKSLEASAINQAGFDSQVRYLLEGFGGNVEALKAAIMDGAEL